MKELLVRIRPISEFPSLHSDKLFGAICFAINDLYGEEKLIDMIENFKKEPPFILSSAFPCIDYIGDKIYFLPKPIESLDILEDHKNYIDGYKKLKNVKYISKDIFNDWINGRINETYLLKNIDKYNIKTGLLFPKDKILKFVIEPYDIPRNRINRLNNSSEDLFYFEGNYCKNVSLFFIIRIYDSRYEELLRESIKFLSNYRGFGANISIGKGEFEIEDISENIILEIPKEGNHFMTLSRYRPSNEDINIFKNRQDIFYELYVKRGRMPNADFKKQVYFFTEGSTFPNLKKTNYGTILHVHERSIEYGYAFNVILK